jgi:uncharacterized protein (TIGR01777 family)
MIKDTVLVTGASGFIGQQLVKFLLEQDYQVIALSRKKQVANHPSLQWVQQLSEIRNPKIDYVVNLAGESIGQGRWTDARKQTLIQSRVQTTEEIYQYLKKQNIQPKRIISGSAVGFYGIDAAEQWTAVCDEQSAPQNIFMSELCQRWEQAALSDTAQKTKIIRLGVVFGKGGGILPQMLLPIKLNLAGKIGSGKQPMCWVHMQDVIQAIHFLFKDDSATQIYNVVAPERSSQKAFVSTASLLLKRKPWFSMPAWCMSMLMGEQAQLVLNGQYVKPVALEQAGFKFQYPVLKSALKQILSMD